MWGEEGSEKKSCEKAAQKVTSACLGRTIQPSDDKGQCRHNGVSWFISAWTSWPHTPCPPASSCANPAQHLSHWWFLRDHNHSPMSHCHSAATLFPRRFHIFSSQVLAFPTCWESAVISTSTEVSISDKYLPPTPSLFGCVFWGLSPQTELYK